MCSKIEYTYYKKKCSKCGRKILVEIVLIGTNHNADIIATCAECLKKESLPKEFVSERPEIAKDIEEWINEI